MTKVYPMGYMCQVLLGNALIPMTRTPRLGAGRVVAAHDLAGAAAADALVAGAAVDLGDLVALGAGEASLGGGCIVPGGGEQGTGARIGSGRKREESGGKSQYGEQGADAHDGLLGRSRLPHYSRSGTRLCIA